MVRENSNFNFARSGGGGGVGGAGPLLASRLLGIPIPVAALEPNFAWSWHLPRNIAMELPGAWSMRDCMPEYSLSRACTYAPICRWAFSIFLSGKWFNKNS